jgi:hypothetical protein
MNKFKLPPDDDQAAICFMKTGINIFKEDYLTASLSP